MQVTGSFSRLLTRHPLVEGEWRAGRNSKENTPLIACYFLITLYASGRTEHDAAGAG